MEPGRFLGNPSYYALLEVSPDADAATVQAAFRRQVRRFHPDVNPDPAAAARMRDLNAAYAILGDPVRRAAYDAAHATDRDGGAIYAGPRPERAGTPARGVRAAGGSYAPRWGGVVGGRAATTVGVATAATHGTTFIDAAAEPVPSATTRPAGSGDLGWATRVSRAIDTFGTATVREVTAGITSRTTVTPTTGTSRTRALGGILAVIALAIAGAAAGTAMWGGPGILSTASITSGGASGALPGAPMVAPPAARKPATVAVVAPAAPVEPLAPLAPAVAVPAGAAIPAPLAPLGAAPAPAAPAGATRPVTEAPAGATRPVTEAPAGATRPVTEAPVAAVPDTARAVAPDPVPAAPATTAARAVAATPVAATPVAATATPGLRALNAYDQAWTTYASILRRGANGDAAASGAPLTMARVRLLEARAAWIRQAGATGDPVAAARGRDAVSLTSAADDLARDAATLIANAGGAPAPAAKTRLDDAARLHARALAAWVAATPRA